MVEGENSGQVLGRDIHGIKVFTRDSGGYHVIRFI